MPSRYQHLANLSVVNHVYSDPNVAFLVSKGNWTSDDPLTGDIFTSLSSYRVPYGKLSSNFRYAVEHAVPELYYDEPGTIVNSSISVTNGCWDFTANGGLRVATNGPFSSVTSCENLNTAAMNFETCRAISSDAWWCFQRKCFDAAHAREMSGVANRMMLERGKVCANKYSMTAIVYDLGNRHWLASEYYRRQNSLTYKFECDKEKKLVTIHNAAWAKIPKATFDDGRNYRNNGVECERLYNICPFRWWSVMPYDYIPECTKYGLFNVGTEKALSVFSGHYIVHNNDYEKPISYYLIDRLNELSDVKANIDISLYNQNRYSSLCLLNSTGAKYFDCTVNNESFHIGYKELSSVYRSSPEIDPERSLNSISNPSAYGPAYMGNIYLYPVFEPYEFEFWRYWKGTAGSIDYGIYQSEPNPCGSKTAWTTLPGGDYLDRPNIVFNPQQAIWEYYRYFKTMNLYSGQELPGDLVHFNEKFCRIRIYARIKTDPPPTTELHVKCNPVPPRPYVSSPMPAPNDQGEVPGAEVVLTYAGNMVQEKLFMSDLITVCGNAPTKFFFRAPNAVPPPDGETEPPVNVSTEWQIWISEMVIW